MNLYATLPDTTWMSRCFDLARRGIGHVSPNPPVGAVLVYQNRILSEGYHTFFGGPHAEVEAVRNVQPNDRHLISASKLYVSLEPCCITGKTPPCTDLIIREGIRDVRISTRDPNPDMAGNGVALLKANGIHVAEGILEEEGKSLIRSFTTNILHQRPYIILKWAQSKNGYTGMKGEQVWLSHPQTQIWTHKQRAEVDAIVVGARTVETDSPSLTARSYPGRSPARVIYDPNSKLKGNFEVFKEDGCRVFYFSNAHNPDMDRLHVQKIVFKPGEDVIRQMLSTLFTHKAGKLLIEGGSYMHHLFIKKNLWDEAWVIRTQHALDHGIKAPDVKGKLIEKLEIEGDVIVGIQNQTTLTSLPTSAE